MTLGPQLPDLLTLLWETHHAMLAMSRHMERNIGVTGPQRLVLREVERQPGISPGDLAGVLGVHASTVTGLIDRLVDRGLLTRETRSDDRRSFALGGTRAGSQLLSAPGRTIEAVVDATSTGIPEADLEAAARVLHAIAAALRTAAGDDGDRAAAPASPAAWRAASHPPSVHAPPATIATRDKSG